MVGASEILQCNNLQYNDLEPILATLDAELQEYNEESHSKISASVRKLLTNECTTSISHNLFV